MMLRELKAIKDSIVGPEMEIILHPSRKRLQWLGIFTVMGHAGFFWLWSQLLPQPHEDWRVRLLLALTGLGLIFQPGGNACNTRGMKLYFSLMCWLQLPLFFVWMYWMNQGSAMWMATVATMVVVYYHLTDWRAASLGLFLGAALATELARAQLGQLPSLPLVDSVVFAFSWICSTLLALSSANLRRERLRHALTVIGIMAHELRTPLATLALIAQAVRSEAKATDDLHASRLQELAERMEALTRAINHHIDLQMTNARYTHQISHTQLLSAHHLVLKVLKDYPFGSRRERNCVECVLHEDFWFYGSERQFTQVLNNLIKNAMHSLKAAQSRYAKGDLRIELGARGKLGRIQILDRGVGINSSHMSRIFEPFFSTANETGHGLGLAFCKQVVDALGGTILVTSEPAMGATFTLQLPCQAAPVKHHATSEISPLSPA